MSDAPTPEPRPRIAGPSVQPVPAAVDTSGLDYGALPVTSVREAAADEPARARPKLRWGGVIAGLFIAVGVELALALLGAAIGLSVLDARGPSAIAGVQASAAVWAGIIVLVGALVGGFVAARASAAVRRTEGALLGILVWAVSLVGAFALSGGDLFDVDLGSISSGARESSHTITMRALGRTEHRVLRVQDEEGTDMVSPIHDAAQTAWGLFLGVAISFAAGAVGGMMGARGERRRVVVATAPHVDGVSP
jgi:hypothetical protein